jgi:hypothetical protein
MLPLLHAFLLVAALVPALARAEAIAPTTRPSTCLDPDVEVVTAGAQGGWLYRIVFRNNCDAHRSLYWCADNPGATLPEQVACPRVARADEAPAEPRHFVLHRKEFQWHLPPGTRIRYRDCPAQEVPTYGMGCASAPNDTKRR